MYSQWRDPEFISELRDGTVKQLNPFTGTEVWTVPGRGNRPLGIAGGAGAAKRPGSVASVCAFCADRYLETPPEKSRVVRTKDGWETKRELPADELFDSVAEFRRVPNLFEILSYDYWHLNYGFELPSRIKERKEAYLASDTGRQHVLRVVRSKLRAAGHADVELDKLSEQDLLAHASGFFGGGHDVIVARRHFVDGAESEADLASAGKLTPVEHRQFIAFTVAAIQSSYQTNPYARYVSVFQNWLKPAGASFDHLHKQLVAIDERGTQVESALARLRENLNIFNDVGPNYAVRKNLIIAQNDHAVAFAGFGHRYPTIEVYAKSAASFPWEQEREELDQFADLLHAMHAATGADVACNEEWHYRPIDAALPMPLRVMLKWRVSTLAGFEGATKIYLNTISPAALQALVTKRLVKLRAAGLIVPDLAIADELRCSPNPLRYGD